MELTVPKKDLVKLIARMQGVAERKSTMPVLSNVLLAVDGPSMLRIAATDMYLALVGRLTVDVSKGGSVAVSAKDLLERIRMMPEGPIHLASQDGTTTIRATGSARRYTLRGMPGDDFPPLPAPAEGAPSLALSVDVLRELIAKTHFSISTDETRAHLNSALFEWDGDLVRMVTTDGHRLSKMEVRVTGRQASATMLIPLKAIQELRRLCDDMMAEAKEGAKDAATAAGSQLQITQSGSNAFFQGGGVSFAVRLVDAQFPPYAQVIPQHSDKVVRIARGPFAEALRAVSVAASERTGGIKIGLSKATMRITTESPESGEGFDELPIEYSGQAMTIGFNAKYFLDVLGSLDEDEVELGLGGELDPAVIKPAGPRQFLAVVMPMRI
jgi:DNA polymerase-3 subunit beta